MAVELTDRLVADFTIVEALILDREDEPVERLAGTGEIEASRLERLDALCWIELDFHDR